MIATEIATVGITRMSPKISILPSGTPSSPARARAPTPGTMSTMPHSRPMARAVAMRAVPTRPTFGARLRASGAEMTSRTSRKMDCSNVAIVSDSA